MDVRRIFRLIFYSVKDSVSLSIYIYTSAMCASKLSASLDVLGRRLRRGPEPVLGAS